METWDDWSKAVMGTAKKICRVTKKHRKRKTWWWNAEAVKVVKEKKRLYKKRQQDKESKWSIKTRILECEKWMRKRCTGVGEA